MIWCERFVSIVGSSEKHRKSGKSVLFVRVGVSPRDPGRVLSRTLSV